MENRGLLFIPDISGFTRFVNQTEIEHSRLIIQELLEILINANDLGLKISEVEGDAILFYKFGEPPDLKLLSHQVEKMFCEFHQSLSSYEMLRYCQCQACTSAVELTLKIITHHGEFTEYNVKDFHKLIGKDLIVAHQLLKNDIQKHEYWLITPGVTKEPETVSEWVEWLPGVRDTEAGQITFHYTPLSSLKKKVHPARTPQHDLTNKKKVITCSDEYESDMIKLFHATGDFQYRHRWFHGVKKTEEASHFLPRVGMKCRCYLDNGQFYLYSSSYEWREDRIEFSETNESDQSCLLYRLEKLTPSSTKLTLEYYVDGPWQSLIFGLFRRDSWKARLEKSLANLHSLVEEMKIEQKVV